MAVLSHRLLEVVDQRDAAREAFAAAAASPPAASFPSLLSQDEEDSSSCDATSSEEGDGPIESDEPELPQERFAAPVAGTGGEGDWMRWSTTTMRSEGEGAWSHRDNLENEENQRNNAVAAYYMETYQPQLAAHPPPSVGSLSSLDAHILEQLSAKLSMESLEASMEATTEKAAAPKKKMKKRTTSLPPRSTSRSQSRKASPSPPGARTSPNQTSKPSVAATVASVARNARARFSLRNSSGTVSKSPPSSGVAKGKRLPSRSKAPIEIETRGRSLEKRSSEVPVAPSAMRVIINKKNPSTSKPNANPRKPLGAKAVNTVAASTTAPAAKRSRSAPPKKKLAQSRTRPATGRVAH